MRSKCMFTHPNMAGRNTFLSKSTAPPMANDEPMVDPKFKPDPIPQPLDHEHGQPRKPNRKLKYHKTRRGWVKHKANKKMKFSLLGNNSAGLKAKKDSLEAFIELLRKPSCITLQEMKLPKKCVFQLDDYQVFQKK